MTRPLDEVIGVEQHVGHVEPAEKGKPEYGQRPGVRTAAEAEFRAGANRLTTGSAFGIADLHDVILQVSVALLNHHYARSNCHTNPTNNRNKPAWANNKQKQPHSFDDSKLDSTEI